MFTIEKIYETVTKLRENPSGGVLDFVSKKTTTTTKQKHIESYNNDFY